MTRVETIGDCRNRSDRSVAIYALCDADWSPRYVGKTVTYLHIRHKSHIRAARRYGRLPVHRWIRKALANSDRLCIRLLEYVDQGKDWAARERHWIEALRAEGARLLNLTIGGEGLAGHRPSTAHREAIAAALRTGSHFSCLRCGSQFWRKANQIARGHNKFCSHKCANIFNRGGRRGP